MRISDWSSDVCSSDLSDRYEDILAALEKDGGEWAAKELDALHTKSPQTCKVALRQLREGAAMPDFAAEMARVAAMSAEERIKWEADVAACDRTSTRLNSSH